MKVLFLTDLEAQALLKILPKAIATVPGGAQWQKQSVAGVEYNYRHSMLMTLTKRVWSGKNSEDRERMLCEIRERKGAIKMARLALDL